MAWELIIPGIAAGLNLLAIGIELMMHDREKAQTVEFAIRRKQAEVKKYQKEKNTKAMMATQKELMGLMSQNFKLRSKTMIISFPLFIIIFWALSGMLNVAPLYAGQTSQMGFEVRNLASGPQEVYLELSSQDMQVLGQNLQIAKLDDKGDQGDKLQVWWNVTAQAEGKKQYLLKASSADKSDEKQFSIGFAAPGSLSAGFSPEQPVEILSGSLAASPVYRAVEPEVAGLRMSWFIYYLITYFAISAAFTPLKNYLLWGHHKGIKHLERMDREGRQSE
jgi:uncharacterized membrane protein (DUF106 family)